jgi:excisionase family DNA binding protein
MEMNILTIPEVAAYLKISKSKVYDLVHKNEIPHIRLGRNVRILESDLIQWLQTKRSTEQSQLVFMIDNLAVNKL